MRTATKIFMMTLAILFINLAIAQDQTMVFNESNSTLTVEGTSNLHDWDEKVTEFNGTVTLPADVKNLSGNDSPIKNVSLTAKAKSLESGKSIMDNKTQDALQSDDYPEITFTSTKAKLYKTKDAANGSYVIIVYGDVEIAGKTKEIYFPVTTKLNDNGTWNVSGHKKLYLKWFDIDPPSAMMGTVTVGDEIDVIFDINLQAKDKVSN